MEGDKFILFIVRRDGTTNAQWFPTREAALHRQQMIAGAMENVVAMYISEQVSRWYRPMNKGAQ